MESDIEIITDHVEIHPGANGGYAVVRDGAVYGTYPDHDYALTVASGLSEDESDA